MIGLPSPTLIAAALVGGIALAGSSYWWGSSQEATYYKGQMAALQIKVDEASQKQRQAELIQSSNASVGFENDTAKTKIVYRTIHDKATAAIINNPVEYRNVCLDDNGLQLANAALAGVATAAPAANLIQPCPKLSPLSDGSAASLLNKIIEISQQYYDCSRQLSALVDAVK